MCIRDRDDRRHHPRIVLRRLHRIGASRGMERDAVQEGREDTWRSVQRLVDGQMIPPSPIQLYVCDIVDKTGKVDSRND